MSREWAQMLGKICRDLIETGGKNIDRVDAVHQQWLGKDVYHCLGINWDPRSKKVLSVISTYLRPHIRMRIH